MKQFKWLILVALVTIGLNSCEMLEEPINVTDLFGLWEEQENGIDDGEYMRFLTADQEPQEGEYYFGREWDEKDDVYESDLKYKGNGWFKWKIEGRTLTKIELMDNGGSDIPKTYTIDRLTAVELVLCESYDKTDKDTWSKRL